MSILNKIFGRASARPRSPDAVSKHLDLWAPRYIKGDLIMNVLDREEIVGGHTGRVEADVRRSIESFRAGKRPLRTIHFSTNAYDKDKRALFQVPEMRQWCQVLYKRIPYVFSMIDAPTLSWFFLCVADVEVASSNGHTAKLIVKPELAKRLNDEIIIAMNELFNSLASTKPEFDQLVAESLDRLLGRAFVGTYHRPVVGDPVKTRYCEK